MWGPDGPWEGRGWGGGAGGRGPIGPARCPGTPLGASVGSCGRPRGGLPLPSRFSGREAVGGVSARHACWHCYHSLAWRASVIGLAYPPGLRLVAYQGSGNNPNLAPCLTRSIASRHNSSFPPHSRRTQPSLPRQARRSTAIGALDLERARRRSRPFTAGEPLHRR